jgi:hypothetical protein
VSRAQAEPSQALLKVALRLDAVAPGMPATPADVERICDTLRAAGAASATRPVLAAPRVGRRSGGDQVPDVIATVTGSATALGQVISALKSCLASLGTPRRSVELTINGNSIQVTGLSRENEDRLIAVFIQQACGKS